MQSPSSPWHVRIARPVSDISQTQRMYCEGLGLLVLDSFQDHEGFDGVMLGLPGTQLHFEFTHCRSHPVVPAPTPEDLAVFYIPGQTEWQAACARMRAAGFATVRSLNPYWDVQGRTFEDHDGYRTVLQNASWSNETPAASQRS
jgi:catechol 2,3-dioxygenase-like lactoylglutathione lyase family enzyme